MSRFTRDEIGLTRDDRLMTWSSNLNIYRVIRQPDLIADHLRVNKNGSNSSKNVNLRFDLIRELLARNMVDCVEDIFAYAGLENVQDCLLVCKLWRVLIIHINNHFLWWPLFRHDFLSEHVFRRWTERLLAKDESVRELAADEGWTEDMEENVDQKEEMWRQRSLMYRRICFRWKISILYFYNVS